MMLVSVMAGEMRSGVTRLDWLRGERWKRSENACVGIDTCSI